LPRVELLDHDEHDHEEHGPDADVLDQIVQNRLLAAIVNPAGRAPAVTARPSFPAGEQTHSICEYIPKTSNRHVDTPRWHAKHRKNPVTPRKIALVACKRHPYGRNPLPTKNVSRLRSRDALGLRT
jgi:hypothetical protein